MSEKKTESLNPLKMIKLGVILAIYACVACVGLAFVYSGTLDIITLREQEALEHALQVVFPNADSFSAISALASTDPAVTIEDAYAVFARGELIGAAIRTSRFSYSGPIKILVGVGVDNRISGIQILDNIDTPGLGSNASSRSYFVDRPHGIRFYDQFAGKSVSDPFIPKQDVIAIAAATITSRAVTSSVKAAGEAAVAWFATGGSR
ncbi:MAG: FMN-binding protein [Treponema sp.]|nr:FMN-binding protein [Treponema sp.]